MTQYRVVREQWSGFEAQKREWYWPFWTAISNRPATLCENTKSTVEEAVKLINDYKNGTRIGEQELGNVVYKE